MEAEGPDDPALAIAARHALHDEELIAAFATDGEAVEGSERARSLIERCVACRDLHADLVAIGGMLRTIEKSDSVAATLPAPRDFRLSIETANRLRPGSVALRLRHRLAAALASFSRPVGLSMASLGVVGLLLGTLSMGGVAGPASAPEDQGGTGSAAGATVGPGEVTGPAGTAPAGTAPAVTRTSFDTRATASPPSPDAAPAQGPLAGGGLSVPTLVVGASLVLLVGGVVLLMLGPRRREPLPGR